MRTILCATCYWKNPDESSCKAFPYGIPLSIITGKADHHKPFPGDGGTVYRDSRSIAQGATTGQDLDSTAKNQNPTAQSSR
jgi:hypothetical protein